MGCGASSHSDGTDDPRRRNRDCVNVESDVVSRCAVYRRNTKCAPDDVDVDHDVHKSSTRSQDAAEPRLGMSRSRLSVTMSHSGKSTRPPAGRSPTDDRPRSASFSPPPPEFPEFQDEGSAQGDAGNDDNDEGMYSSFNASKRLRPHVSLRDVQRGLAAGRSDASHTAYAAGASLRSVSLHGVGGVSIAAIPVGSPPCSYQHNDSTISTPGPIAGQLNTTATPASSGTTTAQPTHAGATKSSPPPQPRKVFSLALDPLTTAQRLHELTRQREHRDHQRRVQEEGCGHLPSDTPEVFGDLSSDAASSVDDGSQSPGLGAVVSAPAALKRR